MLVLVAVVALAHALVADAAADVASAHVLVLAVAADVVCSADATWVAVVHVAVATSEMTTA